MSAVVNAYMCTGPECGTYGYGYEPPEPFLPMDIVVAQTRGIAKALFSKKYAKHDVEFTDVRTKKMPIKVEGPEGVVEEDDPRRHYLWFAYSYFFEEPEDLTTWEDFLEEEGQELVATFGDLD